MKKLVKKMGFISTIILSSFGVTSLVQPANAQAAIGASAWPLFPLMVVGAALEVVALCTGSAAVANSAEGFHRRASNLWGVTLGEFFLGLLFLDDQSQTGTVQKVSPQEATQYGLTESERLSYNEAVDNGDMEAIFQQASQELTLESSHEQAKEVMQTLLAQLQDDAHRAFNKIARHLVTNR